MSHATGGQGHAAHDSWAQMPSASYSLIEGNTFLMRIICFLEDYGLDSFMNNFVQLWSIDAIAWVVCSLSAFYFVQRISTWRPRTVLAILLAWCTWFLIDFCFGRGPSASVDDVIRRSSNSLAASRELARCLVKFVSTWLTFLLPFLGDAWALATNIWDRLSPQQRLFLCSGVLAIYATVEACHAVYQRSAAIKKIVFQASFLIVGPGIWLLSGALPVTCLPWLLSLVLSGMPTLASFHTVRQRLQTEGRDDKSSTEKRSTTCLNWLDINTTSKECCEALLSFWVCWPVLMWSSWSLQHIHELLPHYAKDGLLQPSELQRALLVFACWALLWKGGRLLHLTMRCLLGQISSDILAGPLNAMKQLFLLISASLPGFQTVRQTIGQIREVGARYQGSWKVILLATTIGVLCMAWVFYRALSLFCGVLTLLAWACVAVDTADIVFKESETAYTKRLSFWVLAQIWDVLSQLPLAGAGLTLLNPVAFTLFLLVGDRLLEWLIIPICTRVERLPRALLQKLCCGALGRPKSDLDPVEPDETGCQATAASKQHTISSFLTLSPDIGLWRLVGMLSGIGGGKAFSLEAAICEAAAAAKADGLLPNLGRKDAHDV